MFICPLENTHVAGFLEAMAKCSTLDLAVAELVVCADEGNIICATSMKLGHVQQKDK